MMRLAFSLLLASGVALAEAPPAPIVSVFGPGEQTTYDVSYLGIPTGRAQITVGWTTEQFGRDVWPLVCVGETTKLGAVYPIKDRFISYWDPRAQRPVGADYVIHESSYRAKERYAYDHATGKAFVTRQSVGKEPTARDYDIEQGTVDLAAAGFTLRNTPLVPGQVRELPVFTGRKLFKMHANVVGKETISTGLGDVEVYRVTVNADFDGKLETEGLMTLFYTADEKQLPVLAEARFVVGTVRIEAVKYEPGMRFTGGE